ncbi:MAG: TatD family hydrolase [Candidatus Krumholzibacteriia bacterium]
MLVDTHVHLNSPDFDSDLGRVLERARAAGVQRCLCPGYDLPSSRAAVELASRDASILAAVGVHPHDARLYDDATERELQAMLASRAAVAAGEMGLDFHYDHSPRHIQREVLRRQLRLARRQEVPVILHNRESDEDMARILDEEAAGLRGVLHAFTGARVLLEVGRRLHLFFGIGGFLTFDKHPLAACVCDLPRESLLLETDAPYLSPHPMRGRRNEPGRVEIIARRLAEILEISFEEVAALTTRNCDRFLEGS